MFELTDAAGERLHKSLASTAMPEQEGKCFRVGPKDDKLTLKIATPAPSDSTFEYDGSVVLAVPKAIGPYFRDKSLDINRRGQLKLI